MFWFCAVLSAAGVLESVVCSCLVAELAGYWLYRLLPIEKLPFLGRHRWVHPSPYTGRVRRYRPGHRSDKGATDERMALGNRGFEGLAPSAVLLIVFWGGSVPGSRIVHIPHNRAKGFRKPLHAICGWGMPLKSLRSWRAPQPRDIHPARVAPNNLKGLAVPWRRYRLAMPLSPLGSEKPLAREAAFQ
jgi:hypothetical protein